MKRREFLKLSCGLGCGVVLSGLGFSLLPIDALAQELKKINKIKNAYQSTTICFYCAVGCGLICSTDKKTGELINVEGDPEHPVNEGSLCAKGAGTIQTSVGNDKRLTKVLYREPYTDKWVEKSWDFAIDKMARNIKKERDKSFMEKNAKGQTVNRVESIGHLGSSCIDSEECWTMVVMARSLGLVNISHQAQV